MQVAPRSRDGSGAGGGGAHAGVWSEYVKQTYTRRPNDSRCAADVPKVRCRVGGACPYLNHANGVAGELAAGLPEQLGEARELLLTELGGCGWRSSLRLWSPCRRRRRRLLLRQLDVLEASEATLRRTAYASTAGAPCARPAPPAPCLPCPVSGGRCERLHAFRRGRTSSHPPATWGAQLSHGRWNVMDPIPQGPCERALLASCFSRKDEPCVDATGGSP